MDAVIQYCQDKRKDNKAKEEAENKELGLCTCD